MAEKAAHLTGTIRNKPSIFDVVASNNLNSTFYPAFQKLAQFIVKQNPHKLSWLLKYYDEIFLVANGLLQHHYLKTYHGSLAEVFYGLRRRNSKTGDYGRRDYVLSFLTLVILPYVGRKLDRRMAQLKEDILDLKTRDHKALVATYFNLKGLYELAKLIQYVSFLTKGSNSGIFLQRLCNLQLEYAEPYHVEWTWRDVLSRNVSVSKVFNDLLFRGLELSAFFLQFIQWFQNESRSSSFGSLPKPDPPGLRPEEGFDGVCPICLQKWEIPTVVGVSGYVYCYKCIHHYFDTRKQEDPVTKCAACIDDLRHLYED